MPCAYLALVQQAIRLTRPHFMQAARWGVAIGSIGFFLLYEDLPQLILQTQYGNWRGWCAPARHCRHTCAHPNAQPPD